MSLSHLPLNWEIDPNMPCIKTPIRNRPRILQQIENSERFDDCVDEEDSRNCAVLSFVLAPNFVVVKIVDQINFK